jgi:hypothetical protein
MMDVKISGLKELQVYVDGLRVKTNKAKTIIPYNLARKVSKNIKSLIRREARWVGQYHRVTGTGLADSITWFNESTGVFVVRPIEGTPITTAGTFSRKGKTPIYPPSVYADFVEYGNSVYEVKFSGKRYFERGLKISLKEIDNEINKQANKITR